METSEASVRRARWFLRIFGIFFLIVAIYLAQDRTQTREYAPELCGVIGCLFAIVGQFAPSRWVKRTEMLLIGWF
jgi:vacuolar-type H+-ATPase subunit I/STV1